MTDQEINREIAKACGRWGKIVLMKRGLYYRSEAKGYTSRISEAWMVDQEIAEQHYYPHGEEPVTMHAAPFPNYCEDLNAMHEAERTLSEKECVWYLQKLSQVRLNEGHGGMIACMIDRLAFATARQRAEAFLRVKGLWK